MKENYKAWIINYSDFYNQKSVVDELKFLIRFAILAPSGHNAQSWKFIVENNTIVLLPESTRDLSKSDPIGQQLFISLGCAVENLLIAADYYNLETEVEYLPPKNKNAAVKITFIKRKRTETFENHLIFSIPKRHTNRNKYEARKPDERFISRIKNLQQEEDIHIDFIDEKKGKEALADISLKALIETMDNDNFRDELSHYIKSNFTKAKIGMPGFSHGIPGPISFFASKMIRRVNMNRLSLKADEQLLKKFTPLFCLISSKNNDKKSWLRAGQKYEQIALEAERNNLKTAILAAPIQKENFKKELGKLVEISYSPQVLFRIGYCEKNAYPTPRLPFKEVIETP